MDHILSAIKEGNHKSFEILFNQLYKKVYHFFCKRTGDNDVAEDLTQTCFLRLWQYRHNLSENHTIDQQVFTICFSLLINHAKQKDFRNNAFVSYLKSIPPDANKSDNSRDIERKEDIKLAMDVLPTVCRKVVSLKLLEGYSNKEIAQSLSISVKTVEGHITKAIRYFGKKDSLLIWFLLLIR